MTILDSAVVEGLEKCQVTRLAHFTPSLNLFHILKDGAIRSSADLATAASDYFSPTDKERFDQNPDKVCCSFQYPNGYYLAQARGKPSFSNYPDWVCLLLRSDLAARTGALFAPCNAATQRGVFLRKGAQALLDCFAPISGGWNRGPNHLPGAATNLQAEVLIPGPIDVSSIISIVVPTKSAASTESSRLKILGLDPTRFSWAVSSVLFKRDELSRRVRFGNPIGIKPWIPSHDGDKP
ncbi:DarT ssDNA thymidine ADP-ribosyltransferase family protein [Streptomyces sp. NPDC058642]|uniref:DarT ssDNA thymidine ADP-ribosyltransferase family protein n=1 Tax=Streptomyces sp. NPDC058642 TaxID=3346572 RepID=UPI00365A8837